MRSIGHREIHAHGVRSSARHSACSGIVRKPAFSSPCQGVSDMTGTSRERTATLDSRFQYWPLTSIDKKVSTNVSHSVDATRHIYNAPDPVPVVFCSLRILQCM